MQFRRFRFKMQRVRCVCISHLHGDHYFGLVGMLNSMQLLGRQKELIIVCPEKLREVLNVQFEAAGGRLNFPIRYVFLDFIDPKAKHAEVVLDDRYVVISAFPLKHRIPCYGFLITEKERPKSMLREAIEEYDIPYQEIDGIRHGKDFIDADGRVVPNHKMTLPAPPVRTYAYCTDTHPLTHLPRIVEGVDLLYHEATFMESEAERAKETFHSTARQAAELAKNAAVKKLLIGHYSARYRSLEPLLVEAREAFPHTFLAIEGEEIAI